ncbi:MAG TPA: FG-GAP repeat protein, partial [bacterium]|nr:FG-GAP repeat protein [bacterium]
GDGYADLAVGAPGSTGNTVYVYHSSSSGFGTRPSANSTITDSSSELFGAALALGDITGDGYADLAVGARSATSSTGVVYVFHSTGSSGLTATATGNANLTITGEASGNEFGYTVALGDVNGDGFADLVVGAPMANSVCSATVPGRGYVFQSTGSKGLSSSSSITASSTTATTEISGVSPDSFVLMGAMDVNGDGYADVLGGSGGADSAAGRGYVILSGGTAGIPSLTTDSGTPVPDSTIKGETAGDQFGFPQQQCVL